MAFGINMMNHHLRPSGGVAGFLAKASFEPVVEALSRRLRQRASYLALGGGLLCGGPLCGAASAAETQSMAQPLAVASQLSSATLPRALPHWKQLEVTKAAQGVYPMLAVTKTYDRDISIDYGTNISRVLKQALGKFYANPDAGADYRREAPFYYADFTEFPGFAGKLVGVEITANGHAFPLEKVEVVFSQDKLPVPLSVEDPKTIDTPTSQGKFRKMFVEKMIAASPDNKMPASFALKIPSVLEYGADGRSIKTPLDTLKIVFKLRVDEVTFKDNSTTKAKQKPLTMLMTEEDRMAFLEAGGIYKYRELPALRKFLADRDPD